MSSYIFLFPTKKILTVDPFVGRLPQHEGPTSTSPISELSHGPQQAEAKLHLWWGDVQRPQQVGWYRATTGMSYICNFLNIIYYIYIDKTVCITFPYTVYQCIYINSNRYKYICVYMLHICIYMQIILYFNMANKMI